MSASYGELQNAINYEKMVEITEVLTEFHTQMS